MKKKQFTLPALADIPVPDTARYEWQVLSDIIGDNDAMPDVMEIVDESHFTSDHRRDVWNECVRRFNAGEPFDMPSVAIACGAEFVQHIYSQDEVDDVGYRYAGEHARILHTAIIRRRCYMGALRMLELSRDETTTDTSIYSRAADIVADLEPKTVRRELGIVEILNNIADEIQERVDDEKSGRPNRITTGMRALDEVLYGGMAPGNLIIVSARPSVGKTALMLYMARRCAEQGAKAAMFSIEMTADELGTRLIASVSEEYEDEYYAGLDKPRRSLISQHKIARGFDAPEDWDRFEEAVGKLDRLPIIVNDNARDLRDIVSRMTVLRNQGKCDVAFVDYLGLISQAQANPNTPLYQQIGQITSTLKTTGKSLGIPVVLLCQLNRDAEKTDRTPQLHNLRDSGSIEQDCDVALILNQTAGPRLPDLQVWVKKNRNGIKDFGILMRPNDSYTDFEEVDVIKEQ